ncbi:MAG: hypothetical protein LBR73_07735 [Oscillospiraceae bacterium]|jgi:hypothetical protein|nr:hypothetical protein [Oscillospiraceae bacterium]
MSQLFVEAADKGCELFIAAEAVSQALAAEHWIIKAQVVCNGHAEFADALQRCENAINGCGDKLNLLQNHPVFGGNNYTLARQAWSHIKAILVKSNQKIAQTQAQLRKEAEERGKLN